jgi:hypothetical protein
VSTVYNQHQVAGEIQVGLAHEELPMWSEYDPSSEAALRRLRLGAFHCGARGRGQVCLNQCDTPLVNIGCAGGYDCPLVR